MWEAAMSEQQYHCLSEYDLCCVLASDLTWHSIQQDKGEEVTVGLKIKLTRANSRLHKTEYKVRIIAIQDEESGKRIIVSPALIQHHQPGSAG